MYRIHGGTIVCWGAAAAGAAGCGGGACVGVDRVVGGGVSCVVLGGSSWWSVVVVPGGWSGALRFLGGCGTCGVGLAGGGGARVCGLACLPSAPPVAPSSACPLLLSFRWLVWPCSFFFFFEGGWAGVLCVGVGVCRCRRRCRRGCRGQRGSGGCCALGSLCVRQPPGFRFPGRRSGQWWRGACVRGCGSWLVSGWRGRACGCVHGVGRWGGGQCGRGWFVWVSGMCAPKAQWVGLGHRGRCNGWRRCW